MIGNILLFGSLCLASIGGYIVSECKYRDKFLECKDFCEKQKVEIRKLKEFMLDLCHDFEVETGKKFNENELKSLFGNKAD